MCFDVSFYYFSVVTDYLNDVQPGLTKLLAQSIGTNVDRFVHGIRGIHAVDDGTDWSFFAQDRFMLAYVVVHMLPQFQDAFSSDSQLAMGTNSTVITDEFRNLLQEHVQKAHEHYNCEPGFVNNLANQ